MNISLACSTANNDRVHSLKRWLGLNTTAEVYRLALAASFSLPDAHELNYRYTGPTDAGGLVVKENTLFGEDEKIYLGVLRMLHSLEEGTPVDKITEYLRIHLNRGLEHLASTLRGESDAYDQLLYLINEQRIYLPEGEGTEPPLIPDLNLPACKQAIRLTIGSREGQPVHFTPNAEAYDNQHMAIVGRSGSGKTYFAYSLLSQLYRQSQQQVRFLFIDYKGLPEGQLNPDQERFKQETDFQIVDLVNTPFPFNPLRSVRNANPRRQFNQIGSFADALTEIVGLGQVQRSTLIDVIKEQLEASSTHLPTIESLYEGIKNSGRKPDKLTGLLEGLRGLFEDRIEFEEFLRRNTYLSVDASLSDDARIGAVVLVLNLILSQLSRLSDAERIDGYAGLRYFVLIDEAHVVFKQPKARRILDELLRLIRSKGVGIILSTQTLGEFIKDNLSANIATTFLFDSGSVQPAYAADFLRLKDSHRSTFSTDLQNPRKYDCIANLAEYEGYLRFSTRRTD